MKVYISADIEGVTGITNWHETELKKDEYKAFREQMTREVAAACEGALNVGATEIWVKDAHDTGRNILVDKLPEEVRMIRGWSGHPFCMVQELDESFDALLFIGYHSRAGANTNPLAHTMSGELASMTLNDLPVSEFLMHALIGAMLGVPVVFVSGDQGLCQDVNALNEHIETVAVNQGIGDSTVSIHPHLAVKQITAGVENALKQDLTRCTLSLPESFDVEIRYKDARKAYKMSYYPGAWALDSHAIRFETTDYFDVVRFLLFCV